MTFRIDTYQGLDGLWSVVLVLNSKTWETVGRMTDSRAGGYVRRFGMQCWELDALDLAFDAIVTRCEDCDWWISRYEYEPARRDLQGV